MTTIAKMIKQQDGCFVGALVLPALDGKKIHFAPIEKKGKGPEFLVSVGGFEARLREPVKGNRRNRMLDRRAQRKRKNAAWLRTSKKGNAYVSVKLKDPSFHGGTIHPVLVKSESGYVLDWKPRVVSPPPQANASGGRF